MTHCRGKRSGIRVGIIGGLLLLLCFGGQLVALVRLAGGNELHSHLPLIPFISGFLLFQQRDQLKGTGRVPWQSVVIALGVGALALTAHFWLNKQGGELAADDRLVLPMVAFVALVVALVARCVRSDSLGEVWFPLVFLVFMVPMPTGMAEHLSTFLQHASAELSYGMLKLAGTPVFRDELVFVMPGLTLEVAQECSGIRSSLILLITSVLAGHLFLSRGWKKAILVAAVIPLAILRNAFRIVSISLLTIHVDERVIDSPLHHRGGPLFFVLSLVLLFCLLFALRAIGRDRSKKELK